MTINYGFRQGGNLAQQAAGNQSGNEGDTLYIPFATYDTGGSSEAQSGLAVTDIEIFKNGDTGGRATDSGLSLISDTGQYAERAGLNRISLQIFNTTDDTGFYDVGSQYHVAIDGVTIAGKTVRFFPAIFEIGTARSNVVAVAGDTGAAHLANGRLGTETVALSDTGINHRISVVDTGLGGVSTRLGILDTGVRNDTGALNQAVWQADASRTLTAFAHDTGIAQTVWRSSTSGFTGDTGSVGYAQGRLMAVKGDTGAAHLDAGRLGVSATASLDTGATKDAVWGTQPGTSTRYLTGSENVDTGVADTVWKYASRSLTAFAHDTGVAQTVWRQSSSTYTGDTGSVGYAQGRLMAVKGDTGAAHLANGRLGVETVALSDTGINHRIAVVDTGLGGVSTALAVLDTGVRNDTGAVNQAVWQADASRTLTAFAFDTGIAQTVWRESTSTYTGDTGSVAYAQGRLMAVKADTGAAHLDAGRLGVSATASLDTGATKDAVWGTAPGTSTRYLTGSANVDTGVADTVWKYSTSGATGDTGSVGYAQGRLMAVKGDTGAAHLDAGRLGVSATATLDTGAVHDAVWNVAPGDGARALTTFAFDTGIADTVWNEVLTGATHNVVDSAGRRLRDLQEFGVYENGAIWIDTVNGVAGTTNYESGTAFNPVDSIADANTLAGNLGLSRFQIAPGSTITLAASQQNQIFLGEDWTLALGGQNIDGSIFHGAAVTGIATNTAGKQYFIDCRMGNCTLPGDTYVIRCSIAGTQTIGESGDYFFDGNHSAVAGNGTPTIDINSVANVNISWRHYSGGLAIANAVATTNLSYETDGQLVINATCTSLTASIRGNCSVTDNGTTSSLTVDAAYSRTHDTGMADITWENATRTLTAFAFDTGVADTVWKSSHSTFAGDTGSLGYGVGTLQRARGDTGVIHTDQGRLGVISDSGRMAAVLDTGKVAGAVWTSHATRSLTAFALDTGIAQTVWRASSSTFTGDTGSVGYAQGRLMAVRGDTGAAHLNGGRLGVDVVSAAGTAWASGAITAGSIASNAITAAKIAADAIGASELAADAATEIATSVWASATRTITAFSHDTGVADTVWKASRSTYTDTGSFGFGVNIHELRQDTGAAQHLAQLANEYDTGRLPAEASATLDTGAIHDAVWNVPAGNSNRTLTNIDTGAAIHLAQLADEHDTGRLQAEATATLDTGAIHDSVWNVAPGDSTRALTAFAFDTGVAQTVWRSSSSAFTGDTGSVGYAQGRLMSVKGDTGAAHLANGRLGVETVALSDTGINHRIATVDTGVGGISTAVAVLDTGLGGISTRLGILDTGVRNDTGTINQAVWQADASRVLTAFPHDTGVAQTVWRESGSAYTGDTGSVGYAQGRLMAVKGDTGAAHLVSGRLGVDAAAVSDTGINHRIAVLDTGLGGISANADTGAIADAVWAYTAASRTVQVSDTGTLDTIARTLLERPDIDGYKVVEALRGMSSVLLGVLNGAGTTTNVFSELNDTGIARVTATVTSAGNRSAITLALDT